MNPELTIYHGKVRDVFDLGDCLKIITSDRISAFDIVFQNSTIPGRGQILNNISNIWLRVTEDFVPNHVKWCELNKCASNEVLVEKLKPIRFEAIVRGYLTGSMWKEYCNHGTIAGNVVLNDYSFGEKLSAPIFNLTFKSEHDEPATYSDLVKATDVVIASTIVRHSRRLYSFIHEKMLEHGFIFADTKFEFGLDEFGDVILMDELGTPDSSRYWHIDDYASGEIESYDKQIIRDYLSSLPSFDSKTVLPERIVKKTLARYMRVENAVKKVFETC